MKIIYVTTEVYNGIYQNQVIDFVNYLKEKMGFSVQLFSLVSPRVYFSHRKRLKSEFFNTLVFPYSQRLKLLSSLVLRFIRFAFSNSICIGRGPLAVDVILKSIRSDMSVMVIFDARGAAYAESKEFYNADCETQQIIIYEAEKKAYLESNYIFSVSNQLLNYFKKEYGDNDTASVVVPCVIGASFAQPLMEKSELETRRNSFGFTKDDIVLAYSGSLAGWQSTDDLIRLMDEALKHNKHIKIMFLSKPCAELDNLSSRYPERISQFWVDPKKVKEYLQMADYGLLFRNKSIVNDVASPVKFPEYLACGLPVLTNGSVEQVSAFVEKHDSGAVGEPLLLMRSLRSRPAYSEKCRLNKLAHKYYQRERFREIYSAVFAFRENSLTKRS